MKNYEPESAPNPAAWIALNEQERIRLAEARHLAARIKLPNVKAHAAFHAIVENQIAEGHPPAVRALARLIHEGLSRHDALHAIGSVVAEHFFDGMNTKDKDFARTAQARYDAAVERLSAREWKSRQGE